MKHLVRSASIFENFSSKLSLFGLLFLFCTFLGACKVKSDAALRRNFDAHSEGFERIVGMAKSDRGATRIKVMDTAPPGLSISTERWHAYQSLFENLGLKEGLEHRDDFPSGIFLIEDCWGGATSHLCQGYAYSEEPLTSSPPHVEFKTLAHNWYLFLYDD
jgi:hypothetical protein